MGPRGKSAWFAAVAWLAALAGRAHGDGGTVRVSERVGDYLLTVFTAPTPLRAGTIDVSVLVQDARTGRPLSDVDVEVALRPAGAVEWQVEARASHEQATNSLLQAIALEVEPGAWEAEVRVRGRGGEETRRFDLRVAEPLPRWRELWVWVCFPALPVILFLAQQVLKKGQSRQPPCTRAPSR